MHNGGLAVTMISSFDGYNLPIFNPVIRSYRYKLLEKLNKSNRLQYKMPYELGKEVNESLRKGASSIDVVKMLLYKHNLFVRERSIQKRIHRLSAN